MKKERKGSLYVIGAGICWGIIGLFTRTLSGAGITPVQETWIRNLVAATGMAAVILVKDRTQFAIRLRDLWMFLGTGIGSIVFFNICYFRAIELMTMSMAAVLLYTAPCFVMVMSCLFFHEQITVRKCMALLLAFVGCVLSSGIFGSTVSLSWKGILTGLAAGFGYALYSIFGTVALRRYSSVTVTFYTFLIAAAALMPFGDAAQVLSRIAVSPYLLAVGILLGVVSTLLPFWMYTLGLRCLEAGRASVMAFVEPLVATLCGCLVFREQFKLVNLCGMVLIFFSIVLLNQRTAQKGG